MLQKRNMPTSREAGVHSVAAYRTVRMYAQAVEARAHAHWADRTQKPDNSNLFKHKKYGKHAQTERMRRHGQGMGHVGTKGCRM